MYYLDTNINLIVWQKSRTLVKKIYDRTKIFPKEEQYGLTNQIRRAVVSIPSNIAEGYNRQSDKEFVRFLSIAKGSAAEVETQIILAQDLEYISAEERDIFLLQISEILHMLGALIAKQKRADRNA